MYEAEYNHAANLLNHSLEEYTHAHNEHQKEAFRKVMSQALQVLKDTASELNRPALIEHCQQVEKDYQAFQEQQTPETENQLHKDLEKKDWKK